MVVAATIRNRHANGGQGMNFVRPDLRIALYCRDGLACCYCGSGIEEGTKLTLDHLKPHSLGGSNAPENLITACHKCNSSRGNRSVDDFVATVAAYLNHDVTSQMILDHIQETVRRPVDRAMAKTLLARRGGFTAVMHSLKN